MLNQDHRDILSAFTDLGVKFLVVGAHALAAHGVPRATGDLDLHIHSTIDNASLVFDALAVFGAPLDNVSVDDLSKPGTVFQIGVAPNRIDILTLIDGISFYEAWKNRIEIEVDGIQIPIIGRDDLIKNKKAVGRPQDIADVARLMEMEERREN